MYRAFNVVFFVDKILYYTIIWMHPFHNKHYMDWYCGRHIIEHARRKRKTIWTQTTDFWLYCLGLVLLRIVTSWINFVWYFEYEIVKNAISLCPIFWFCFGRRRKTKPNNATTKSKETSFLLASIEPICQSPNSQHVLQIIGILRISRARTWEKQHKTTITPREKSLIHGPKQFNKI